MKTLFLQIMCDSYGLFTSYIIPETIRSHFVQVFIVVMANGQLLHFVRSWYKTCRALSGSLDSCSLHSFSHLFYIHFFFILFNFFHVNLWSLSHLDARIKTIYVNMVAEQDLTWDCWSFYLWVLHLQIRWRSSPHD